MKILLRVLYYTLFKRLNLLKTFYINLKVCGVKFYIFPILIFGKCELKLKGYLEIKQIAFGTWKLGYRRVLIQGLKNQQSQLIVEGRLLLDLNDELRFGPGYKIYVGPRGTLCLRDGYFGPNTLIQCYRSIKFGFQISASWNCEFIDSDSHYILDICANTVGNCDGEIEIGDYCWISNHSTILKNTVLGNNVIVGCRTIINKDFSDYSCVLLAGLPARIKKENCRRIFDNEEYFKKYFNESSAEMCFLLDNV